MVEFEGGGGLEWTFTSRYDTPLTFEFEILITARRIQIWSLSLELEPYPLNCSSHTSVAPQVII